MKTALKGAIALLVLVLLQTKVYAQSGPPVPGATQVGAISVEVHLDDYYPTFDVDGKDAIVEEIIWVTAGGETIISLNVNSTTFPADCRWAETFPIRDLLIEAGKDGLERAIQLGYVACPGSCPNGSGSQFKVYYPTCVHRNTNGACPTLTAASGTSFSYNLYDICCSGSSPVITLLASICGGSSCGLGAELTCY